MKLLIRALLFLVLVSARGTNEIPVGQPTGNWAFSSRLAYIERLQQALLTATNVQIYRIDPCWYENQRARDQDFRAKVFGYPLVFHSALEKPSDIAGVFKSVCDGLKEEAADGSVAMCFDPRHAISFSTAQGDGRIVICYHCNMTEVKWASESHMFRISSGSESVLEAMLLALGSPKPNLPAMRKAFSYKFGFDPPAPKIKLGGSEPNGTSRSASPP